MSDLICDNYSLLLVMSRFGLSLGFGEKSVREVCEQQQVDVNTFLAVANFSSEDHYSYETHSYNLSLASLLSYLQNAHAYFLDFCFPAMRSKLIEAFDCPEDKVASLIMRFYDEYVNEVRKHMEYEDKVVFAYVFSLLKGEHPASYNIGIFKKKHDQIDSKLKEFKNIIIKYYPVGANKNLLNSVLFDIYSCEEDLALHCRVEDVLFVPAVLELERK